MVNQINTPDLLTPLIPVTPEEQQELMGIKAHFNSLLQAIMEESKQLNAKFDLSKVWPATENLPTLYKQLDELKCCLDSFRPISPATIQDMQEAWDIQYTYDSNRIDRKQPVFILQSNGKRHEFPDAYLVSKLIEDYFIFYNENKEAMHSVEMAAHLHQRLVNIHPFIDGNGRTSRLVMNLHLLKNGYPISIIDSEMDKRQEYYRILGEYRGVAEGDSKPFELFVAQKVKDALFEYLQFLSADQNDDGKDKGYTFFKTIKPYLTSPDTDKNTND
jgi:Fic family protein